MKVDHSYLPGKPSSRANSRQRRAKAMYKPHYPNESPQYNPVPRSQRGYQRPNSKVQALRHMYEPQKGAANIQRY